MRDRRVNNINRDYRDYAYYVDGSAARKYDRSSRPLKQVSNKTKKRNSEVRKNRAMNAHIDVPYLILLFIAISVSIYLCYNYLSIQSSILTSTKEIEKGEKELELLRNENDALEVSINTYTDMDYIYKIATSELGMIHVEENQVINYTRSEREYVRQYEDIPEE